MLFATLLVTGVYLALNWIFVLAVALLTSISSPVMIGPRGIAQMADDGFLPRRLSFQGDVPGAAIWTRVVLAVGILWASGLREQLTNLGWILSLFTALTVFALLRLRMREGHAAVPIRGFPWVRLAFLVIVVGLTVTMVFVHGNQLIPSSVVIASGAVLYLWRSKAP